MTDNGVMANSKSAGSHAPLHADELPIDGALVRALLDRDLPEHAGLPLAPLRAAGSTNALFRLGDDLLVRLPRQPGGGESILKEARLAPLLAAALPVAVPEVVAVGGPGFGYPEHWSVTRWLAGEHPTCAGLGRRAAPERLALAEDLADVVRALREVDVPEPVDGELRWYRGGALNDFDVSVRHYLALCRGIRGLDLDLDKAEAMWEKALALPGAAEPGPDRWFHGDLVAENLLVADGRLAAVLDLGAVSVGDPTVDLHGAWEVLDAPARDRFAARLGVDEAEWLRGRAWALGIALGALSYYWESMPGRRSDRLAMARNVLTD